MPIPIRQAQTTDVPYLYDICLKTGFSGKNAEGMFADAAMLGHYYAAPYLFFERECCFVATTGTDIRPPGENNAASDSDSAVVGIPFGYIISTSDSVSFYRWFETEWLPPVRALYPEAYVAASDFERAILNCIRTPTSFDSEPWAAQYPAHLHIDIMDGHQGQGVGRQLMNRLFATLRAKGVPGVHLGVGKKNERAVGFYRKIGFTVLSENDAGLTLGYRL